MEVLIDQETEDLEWDLYDNMVRIRTIPDGSCFFHAIAKAYHKGYRLGEVNGKQINRSSLVRSLRSELSKKLGQKVPKSEKTYYQLLGRGEIEKLSKTSHQYTLDNLQKLLDSSRSIGDEFNEFISNELNKDIYILDGKSEGIYSVGGDKKLLYKDRLSIVLLYIEDPGHYELVGLRDGDNIKTLFDPNHSFINKIRSNL